MREGAFECKRSPFSLLSPRSLVPGRPVSTKRRRRLMADEAERLGDEGEHKRVEKRPLAKRYFAR